MNAFDVAIIRFFNQFANHWQAFDTFALLLAGKSNFFKGGVMVGFIWWLWFRPGKNSLRDREVIVATLCSAVLSVIVGRLMALCFPFRLRPIHTPELGFQLPYGMTRDYLRGWSSFPSDHAMVFFAVSTGLWFISRRLGALATSYVVLFVALPRIYLGLHYPTDIIGGGLVGILFAWAANRESTRAYLTAPAIKWEHAHPSSFYVFFFFFCDGLTNLFDALRHAFLSVHPAAI